MKRRVLLGTAVVAAVSAVLAPLAVACAEKPRRKPRPVVAAKYQGRGSGRRRMR